MKYQDYQLMNNNSTGSIRAAKKIIPELRFPEFANDGEWVVKELIDLVDKNVKWGFTGGPFGSNLKASDYATTGIRIIQLQNIGDGVFNDDYKIYTSIEKADELLSCNIYSGEIILSKMGDPVGRACIIPKTLVRCVMASDGIRLVVDEKKNSKYFIYSLINSKQIRESIEKKATGSTRKRIGLDELKKIPFYIPNSQKEQEKIASCFSTLDDIIFTHGQKLDTLKTYKKGLMQNLFPQEGENVPKWRFPEFMKDGEWVEKPLDDICKLVRGPFGGALKKEIFVKAGYAVYEQSHAIYSDFSSYRYYINEEKFSELKRFSVKSGDLIMSCSGTMGKFAIIPNDYKVGVINQALLKLTVKKGYDSIFVKMTLEAENNQIKLLSQSAGGAIQNVVSVSQIKELSLFIPSHKEQQKVTDCISSLDALINAQAEKIEQLKLHKNGLMQCLFPNIKD